MLNCYRLEGRVPVTLELPQEIASILGYSFAPFAEVLLNEQMRKVNPDYTIEVRKTS